MKYLLIVLLLGVIFMNEPVQSTNTIIQNLRFDATKDITYAGISVTTDQFGQKTELDARVLARTIKSLEERIANLESLQKIGSGQVPCDH